jgi:phage-related protein
MIEILYYPYGDRGPVYDYLNHLSRFRPKAFARLAMDLEVLESEGLRSPRVSIRSLGGQLWELRRLHEGTQYRILLCIAGSSLWLLHHIEKKSAKTPRPDLALARKRQKEVIHR